MAQEAELLYKTVPWEESLLQSAGKKAAGPLFDVKSSDETAVCQLHLPHSETEDGKTSAVLTNIHLYNVSVAPFYIHYHSKVMKQLY